MIKDAEVICTNTNATNFDELATKDDGPYSATHYTLSQAYNYNSDANVDDGSCAVWGILKGCTNINATKFDALATKG